MGGNKLATHTSTTRKALQSLKLIPSLRIKNRMGATSFSEEVSDGELTNEEEVERGGGTQITISNATVFTIFVETFPIELVRRGNLRGYDIALGVDPAALGGEAKVGMGEVGLEKETLESRKQTVHRHSSWSLKLPSEGLSFFRKEKAGMMHNAVFIRLYLDRGNGPEEIGDGYNLGPGHGMIVCEGIGEIRVEEARGRTWYGSYDPWRPKDKSSSLDPHLGLNRRQKCDLCGKRM